MIGLVIVTQGRLGQEFLASAEHIVGPQQHVRTVCMDSDDDMGNCRARIDRAISAVDTGTGVIVVADMFGGTPCNLAIAAVRGPGVEVLAGLNLPMLIKLLKVRDSDDVPASVAAAQDAGRKYIRIASGTPEPLPDD